MVIHRIAILLLLSIAVLSQAQQEQDGRYVVFFVDKGNDQEPSPYSVLDASRFLSEKSIARRQRQGISVTEEDLPVHPTYVAQLAALGIPVYYTLRWVNGALVEVSSKEDLSAITNLASVSRIEYVAPPSTALRDHPQGALVAPIKPGLEPVNQNQLSMIGLDKMHREGIFGAGVTIAVLDAGFPGIDEIDAYAHLFREGRISDRYNFLRQEPDVFRDAYHGSLVLSVMAAKIPDVYIGGSDKANYQLYVTENTEREYRVEEYNWMAAAERADSAGADIIMASINYITFDDPSMDYTRNQLDGKTTLVSQAATKALSKGILVITSVSNSREGIEAPADVDGALVVGAVTTLKEHANFSAVGPTADGRIKPDVAALGVGVYALNPEGDTVRVSGTSFAAPLITSLAAGLLQVYPKLTVKDLYDSIIHSGTNFKSPNNQIGYGIPSYLIARGIITAVEPLKGNRTFVINVFPNPVINHINMQWAKPADKPAQHITVHIYDVSGKLFFTSEKLLTHSNGLIEYDISILPPGTYLFRVKKETDLHTFQFVKY